MDSATSRCTRCGAEMPSNYWSSNGLCANCTAAQSSHTNTPISTPMTGTVLSPDAPVPPSPGRPQAARRPQMFSVTTILVGLNILVFVAMVATGASFTSPTTDVLLKWGANWGPYSLGAQPWRILTSNYLHIGIIHIFFNMWCLWNLGQLTERILDRWTYIIAYTLCGIGGSLSSLWWHPMVVGAGASGAIFGLAGLMITVFYFGSLNVNKAAIRPILRSLISFAGYNLLIGLAPGIDNSAHIGGLVTGLCLGAVFAKTSSASLETRKQIRWLTFAVFAIAFSAGMIWLQKYHSDVRALGRGLTTMDAGDMNKALPDLENSAQKNPRSAQAQFILAQAYLDAHRPDDAIGSFQNVLKITQSAEAERGLAEAYRQKGMQQQADEATQKAEELERK
jgi:rhomboid protease GluP